MLPETFLFHNYYSAADRKRGILWWACMSVSLSVCLSVCLCLCVCPRSYLRNYTSDLHQFFVPATYGRGVPVYMATRTKWCVLKVTPQVATKGGGVCDLQLPCFIIFRMRGQFKTLLNPWQSLAILVISKWRRWSNKLRTSSYFLRSLGTGKKTNSNVVDVARNEYGPEIDWLLLLLLIFKPVHCICLTSASGLLADAGRPAFERLPE